MLLTTLLHLLLLHVSSVILGAGPDLSYLSEIWGPPHRFSPRCKHRKKFVDKLFQRDQCLMLSQ
jgi:hypothetical protein